MCLAWLSPWWAGRNLSPGLFSAPFSCSAHRAVVRSHRFDHSSTSATSTLRCSPPAITSLCSVWSLTGQCPCPGTVSGPLHRCGLERAPLSTKAPSSGPLLKPFRGPCAAVKPASPTWHPGPSSLPSTSSPVLHAYPFLPPLPGTLPAATQEVPGTPLRSHLLLLPLSCGTAALHWTPRNAQLSEAPLPSALSCKLFPSLRSLSAGHSAGLVGEAQTGAVGLPRQTKVGAEVTSVLFKPFFKPSHMFSSSVSFVAALGGVLFPEPF